MVYQDEPTPRSVAALAAHNGVRPGGFFMPQGVYYIVQRGDTLYSIARRYGTTVNAIAAANNIADPNRIQEGTRLLIPVSSVIYRVQPGDTLTSIAARFGVSVQDIVRANNIANPNLILVGQELVIPLAPSVPPPGQRYQTYIVQPGDNLYSIARRFGRTVEELARINNIADPALIFVGQTLLIPQVSPAPQAIYRGNPQKNLIAFTFDATYGDNQALRLLEILRFNNIKATFFLSGIWVRDFPGLVRAINGEGHEIGNHTWDHPHLNELTDAEIRSQITRAGDLIEQTTGRRPVYFRPPFGEFSDRVLEIAAELGYTTIMWTIDSLDWQNPGVDTIVNRVVNNARNGAIVLMHQAAYQTPEALPRIISLLQGTFRFGTVSSVLDP